jgi:hypothetical protein
MKDTQYGIVTGWLDLMICPQAILSLKPYFREFWDHDPHDHWSDDQMSNWQCNGCCQSRGDGWGWTSSSRNCSNPCIITRNPTAHCVGKLVASSHVFRQGWCHLQLRTHLSTTAVHQSGSLDTPFWKWLQSAPGAASCFASCFKWRDKHPTDWRNPLGARVESQLWTWVHYSHVA